MSKLPRIPEPEVMDTAEEAADYDSMDHIQVNCVFVDDLISTMEDSNLSTRAHPPAIVDLGTGTALIPLELLSRPVRPGPIFACDLSWEMLRLADRHIRRAGVSDKVLPVFCDAKVLPMADRSLDVVMSNSIVHHIPDPLHVFSEMRRVLRPGGILFVRDLMRPADNLQVEQFVDLYAADENPHQRQMFRQSLQAALTVEEVAELLLACDLPADWVSATSDRHWTIAGQLSD